MSAGLQLVMAANMVFTACNYRDDWNVLCNACCCYCCCCHQRLPLQTSVARATVQYSFSCILSCVAVVLHLCGALQYNYGINVCTRLAQHSQVH